MSSPEREAIDILFCTHAGPGGANVSLRNLVIDARARGFRVGIVTRSAEVSRSILDGLDGIPQWQVILGTFEHHLSRTYSLRFADVASFAVALLRYVLSVVPLIRALRTCRARILYLNSSVLIPYAVLSSLTGVAVVVHVRERVASGRFGVRRRMLQWLIARFARRVVYIGDEEKNALPVSHPMTLVMKNYVRSSEFPFAAATDFAPGGRALRVLSLGGDVPLKGGPQFEAAALAMLGTIQVAILGCRDPELQKSADLDEFFLANPGRVAKIGHVDRVQSYLTWADLVVFWAMTPHFPRPVFEAWLIGRPVLLSRSAASTEIIARGASVVADGDSTADLSRGLAVCAATYARLRSAAPENRELAMAEFSERNFATLGDELYALLA